MQPYPPLGEDVGAAAAAVLAEAIRYDTTNPPGNERPLAEYLVWVARREGLESRIVETPRGEAPEGRAAAWAVLPGTGAERPLVLLSHLDVVPAAASEWTVEPREGLMGGGFVVGRGALDAKGVAVVHLLALAELERRGLRLDRDVIFLAVPDEETGGLSGAGWMVREHPELLRNAELLLTEGGGIVAGLGGLPDIWGVTFTEKSPCWVELRARGLPGHGASPPAEGAVSRLVEALSRVRELEFPVQVVPEVERMFAELAPLAAPEDRAGYADLSHALEEDPAFRARFLADPGRAALVRSTLALTVLEGSESTNIVPATASARIDARLLPGQSCDAFVATLRDAVDDPDVELATLLSFEAGSSPVDTELMDAIHRVAARRDPDAVVVPRVIPGFTDAHYFRSQGIVSYGFVPRRLRPIDTRGIHGPNERISVDNLAFGVEVVVEILLALAAAD